MSNPRFPQRLELTDMPRDKTRALGGLRQALCASFNYCRKYPAKMAVLKSVLKYTYNRVVQFEKEQAAAEEAVARQRVLAQYTAAGIEADERLSLENLEANLAEALEAKEAQAAAESPETASTATKDTK